MRTAALAAVVVVGWCWTASAQEPYGDPKTPEGWAWAKIRADRIADFSERVSPGSAEPCGELDQHEKASWEKPCRQLPPNFVVNVLTNPKLRDQIGRHGLRLRGARIGGRIDLADTEITSEVWIDASRIEGDLVLADSRLKRVFSVAGTTVTGTLSAMRLVSESTLLIDNHSVFEGDVNLGLAKIGGDLGASTSSFKGILFAESANIAGRLFLDDDATFARDVNLLGAKIGGLLDLQGAAATSIDLTRIDAGELRLTKLGWWCTGRKAPSNVAVSASQANADVSPMQWKLSDPTWRDVQCDGEGPTTRPKLILRNAHVAALQDSADAWPPQVDLEGFRYDRLGGVGGEGPFDMRKRPPAEWIDWLARDPTFSTQPYTQLATVLAAAGHRDTSEAIQFAGRERERSEAHGLHWVWLTFLWLVACYGIGLYTFFVGWWVLFLTLLGALVLQRSPVAQRRGVVWCCGASLHRLLPIIELSKEFTDFFDNQTPGFDETPNLSRVQQAYFAGHAIAGYVVGFFLVAAMSGLTQKS